MASLFQLPPELLILVIEHLDPPDLSHIRLVSKHMHAISAASYVKQFETHDLRFLSSLSRENLVKRSQHGIFCLALVQLQIYIGHSTEEHDFRQQSSDFSDQDKKITYLAKTLSSFLNIKTIILNDITRTRNSEDLDITRTRNSEDLDISSILLAVARSDIPLRCLQVKGWGEAIRPEVFPRNVAFMESLTCLVIHMHPKDGLGDGWLSGFLKFLNMLPHIEEFDFGFNPWDDHDLFSDIAKSVRLQKLQILTIGWASCHPEALMTFLLGHKDTLEEIHLCNIEVPGGEETWRSLLHKICENLGNLSTRLITIRQCLSGDSDVEKADATRATDFGIDTKTDWVKEIEKVTISEDSTRESSVEMWEPAA